MTTYTNEWMSQGLCTGKNISNKLLIDKIFFARKGRPTNKPMYKKYCSVCPVSTKCLKYAIAHDLDGAWGNTTRSQRKILPQSFVLQVVQESIDQGWYEPKLVVKVPTPLQFDLARQMIESLDLTQADFLTEFEYEEYLERIQQTLESFEMLPEE